MKGTLSLLRHSCHPRVATSQCGGIGRLHFSSFRTIYLLRASMVALENVTMSEHTSGLTGPTPKEAGRGTLAILISIVSATIAIVAAYFSYQSNMLTIREKVFHVQADADSNITINQVGGPVQRLDSVKLTPTFQEADGTILPRKPIEIPLQDPDIENITDNGTYYFIKDIRKRICSRSHGVTLAAPCSSTALYHIKVEYAVEGDVRIFLCRRSKCET